MADVYRNHTDYFSRAFGDIDDIAYNLLEAVGNTKFDTMVGIGLSGTLVVPTLARTFGVNWCIIRKEVSIHTNAKFEGEIGQHWLFVDDLVGSGTTLRKVQSVINGLEQYEYDQSTKMWQSVKFTTNYVGTYEYQDNRFGRY